MYSMVSTSSSTLYYKDRWVSGGRLNRLQKIDRFMEAKSPKHSSLAIIIS